MSGRGILRDTEAGIRSIRRRLRTILVREAARKAFDMGHLGTGPLERINVSLVLAGTFGFIALGLSHLVPMSTAGRLALAGAGFATALVTSAALVLWTADDERLAADKSALRMRLDAAMDEKLMLVEQLALRDEEDNRRAARQERRRERERPREKRCPYCREYVLARAVKCKHCGEILDEDLAAERYAPTRQYNPGVAAVLSFLVPGLGQIYKGQVLSGLVWFFMIAALGVAAYFGMFCCGAGLVLLPFIFILQVVCLFDAAARE